MYRYWHSERGRRWIFSDVFFPKEILFLKILTSRSTLGLSSPPFLIWPTNYLVQYLCIWKPKWVPPSSESLNKETSSNIHALNYDSKLMILSDDTMADQFKIYLRPSTMRIPKMILSIFKIVTKLVNSGIWSPDQCQPNSSNISSSVHTSIRHTILYTRGIPKCR